MQRLESNRRNEQTTKRDYLTRLLSICQSKSIFQDALVTILIMHGFAFLTQNYAYPRKTFLEQYISSWCCYVVWIIRVLCMYFT